MKDVSFLHISDVIEFRSTAAWPCPCFRAAFSAARNCFACFGMTSLRSSPQKKRPSNRDGEFSSQNTTEYLCKKYVIKLLDSHKHSDEFYSRRKEDAKAQRKTSLCAFAS